MLNLLYYGEIFLADSCGLGRNYIHSDCMLRDFWHDNDVWHGRSMFTPLDDEDNFIAFMDPFALFISRLLLDFHFLDQFLVYDFLLNFLPSWYGLS